MWFFGYGSLMFAAGINGRGMRHIYSNSELVPVEVSGFKRGLFAQYGNYGYYGIAPSEHDNVFGVLLKIHSELDFEALLRDEKVFASPPVYKVVEIPLTHICFMQNRPSNIKVVKTLMNTDVMVGDVLSAPCYIENVWIGVKEAWPGGYLNRFLATGGISP